jgi:hypothetical protein
MTLKTLMASDLSMFYNTDEFADSITYTPAGEAGISTAGIIDHGALAESQGSDALGAVATLRVQVSEVATAAQGDTVAIGSDTWEVLWAEKTEDNLEWICDISKR